jgi:hypothetical protein
MHKALTTLDHTDPTLALSHSYSLHLLSIIYTCKIGLIMGKSMGRHSHTRYIILNPKRGPKRGRDPAISALSCASPLTACRSPKIRSNMTKNPQNLVKGQHSSTDMAHIGDLGFFSLIYLLELSPKVFFNF